MGGNEERLTLQDASAWLEAAPWRSSLERSESILTASLGLALDFFCLLEVVGLRGKNEPRGTLPVTCPWSSVF